MKTARLATAGITAALAAVVFVGGIQPAGAYVAGDRDWASLEFRDESGGAPISVYLDMNRWGTQYYDGIPPENNGGLGDAVVCLAAYNGTTGYSGTACFGGESNWSIDRLASATIDDTIMFEVRDPDDQVSTESAVIDLTITAQGALYPGAGVTTTPDPGVEVAYSIRRDATVSGTITSPTFGMINLTGAWSTIGWDSCLGPIGVDNLTCRY